MIKYQTEIKSNYLLVHVEGETDNAHEMVRYLDGLLAEPASRESDRFLLDHRNLQFLGQHEESYDVAVWAMERISRERPMKVALLVRPERMALARIYETIGVHAGMKIKVFNKLKMASVWLSS